MNTTIEAIGRQGPAARPSSHFNTCLNTRQVSRIWHKLPSDQILDEGHDVKRGSCRVARENVGVNGPSAGTSFEQVPRGARNCDPRRDFGPSRPGVARLIQPDHDFVGLSAIRVRRTLRRRVGGRVQPDIVGHVERPRRLREREVPPAVDGLGRGNRDREARVRHRPPIVPAEDDATVGQDRARAAIPRPICDPADDIAVLARAPDALLARRASRAPPVVVENVRAHGGGPVELTRVADLRRADGAGAARST